MQPLERTSQGIFSALIAGVNFKPPTYGAGAVTASAVILVVIAKGYSTPCGYHMLR